MVGGSELAFRLLARRHGAQLCYTPMIRSEEFAVPLLERHADDCPLVAHFSGNDPQTLLDAARQAERCRGVVAVDLNLGCPQPAAPALRSSWTHSRWPSWHAMNSGVAPSSSA